jgi:hypothetical protein
MLRLDYLSCFLTIVAAILVGRRMWTGLVVSGVNSLIVCVIGLHTEQYGLIPANLFCILINAFNLRAWLQVQNDPSESTTDAGSKLIAGCKRMSISKKPATRRLINTFRISSEGRLGNSISSLAVKAMRPFAPRLLRTNTNVAVPTLDTVSTRQGWESTNLNGPFLVSQPSELFPAGRQPRKCRLASRRR